MMPMAFSKHWMHDPQSSCVRQRTRYVWIIITYRRCPGSTESRDEKGLITYILRGYLPLKPDWQTRSRKQLTGGLYSNGLSGTWSISTGELEHKSIMRQQIKSLPDENTIPVSRLILFTGVPDSSKVEEIVLGGLTLEKRGKKHGAIGLKAIEAVGDVNKYVF